jgi:hypothetical protein
MTTILKNVDHHSTILASLQKPDASKLLPIIYALADFYHMHGEDWLQTPSAKALVHGFVTCVYGPNYILKGAIFKLN